MIKQLVKLVPDRRSSDKVVQARPDFIPSVVQPQLLLVREEPGPRDPVLVSADEGEDTC